MTQSLDFSDRNTSLESHLANPEKRDYEFTRGLNKSEKSQKTVTTTKDRFKRSFEKQFSKSFETDIDEWMNVIQQRRLKNGQNHVLGGYNVS